MRNSLLMEWPTPLEGLTWDTTAWRTAYFA